MNSDSVRERSACLLSRVARVASHSNNVCKVRGPEAVTKARYMTMRNLTRWRYVGAASLANCGWQRQGSHIDVRPSSTDTQGQTRQTTRAPLSKSPPPLDGPCPPPSNLQLVPALCLPFSFPFPQVQLLIRSTPRNARRSTAPSRSRSTAQRHDHAATLTLLEHDLVACAVAQRQRVAVTEGRPGLAGSFVDSGWGWSRVWGSEGQGGEGQEEGGEMHGEWVTSVGWMLGGGWVVEAETLLWVWYCFAMNLRGDCRTTGIVVEVLRLLDWREGWTLLSSPRVGRRYLYSFNIPLVLRRRSWAPLRHL
jgi:hypothetical protein